MPIGPIEQRPEQISATQRQLEWRRLEVEPDGYRHNHEKERRQQPLRPAKPEADQADSTGPLILCQQQASDQISGQNEKDIYTKKATAKPSVLKVVPEHREDRHGPYSVEGGAVAVLVAGVYRHAIALPRAAAQLDTITYRGITPVSINR